MNSNVPRYVPPPVYGPQPIDTEEYEREANEMVAAIQRAVDEQEIAPVSAHDPIQLLAELVWRIKDMSEHGPDACFLTVTAEFNAASDYLTAHRKGSKL